MNFDYKVIRSNRKTVSVSVSSDNAITVKCPFGLSDSAVDDFIDSKSEWLYRVIAENNVKNSINASILNFSEVYVCGQKVPLIFTDFNRIESDAVFVKDKASIKKAYMKFLSFGLVASAENVSRELKLKCGNFSVRAYKSRWGCCDKYGNITLNYLLTMLPYYLQRYVIVHELCHTVYFNHSVKFWKLVEKYEPNYKICRKNLQGYNFLIKLY